MVNVIFKKMFTLTLVITTFCLYKVNGGDVTIQRPPRQCSTCSGDAAELISSPWYGVPQGAEKLREVSRRYRDTKDQQPSDPLSSAGDEEEKNETMIGKIDLSEGVFGEGNFDEKNNHERKERSHVQEFEFDGKRYALRLTNDQSSIEEIDPQDSSSVKSCSSSSSNNVERLLTVYNFVENLMQIIDPKKTLYENIEATVFDIFRKIIQKNLPMFFNNSGSEEEDDRSSRNYGRQISNERHDFGGNSRPTICRTTQRSEPEQTEFSLSSVGRDFLEQFVTRKQNEGWQSAKSLSSHGEPKFIGAESAAAPCYANPPLMMSNFHSNFRNQGNYVNHPASCLKSSEERRLNVQPINQPSPASVIRNIEESSTIFPNGRKTLVHGPVIYYMTPGSAAPVREMGDTDANRDVFNRKRVVGHTQELPTWTHKREVNTFDQIYTPRENVYNDANFVRLARSERPVEDVASPDLLALEKSDESPNPDETEVPKDLGQSENSDKLENVSMTNDSVTLGESKNLTSISEKLDKALEEYFQSEKPVKPSAETTEIISSFLDELRKHEQNTDPLTTTASSALDPTEKAPTIGEDEPK